MKRLVRSVAYDANGVPRIVSFELADQEWAANTDLTRAPGRAAAQSPAAAGAAPAPSRALAVELEQLAVLRDGELVLVACLRHGGDPDRDFLIPMTPATARLLGARLIQAAEEPPANPFPAA